MFDIARAARAVLPRPFVAALRRLYIRADRRKYVRGIQGFPKRTVRHRYGRIPLSVVLADPLAEEWYDRDWEELPEVVALEHGKLRPGARVFDLGAHQGVVAAMLSQIVGPQGRIVAVDPNPHNVAIMRETLDANAIRNVTTVQAAVGGEPGTARINYRLNTRLTDVVQAQDSEHEVEVTTIDALAERFGAPDVLFIDVEGFEAHVLRGAARTLESAPDCFVEIHVGCGLEDAGHRVEDVLAFFAGASYRRYARREHEAGFRELSEPASSWNERFYLVALGATE